MEESQDNPYVRDPPLEFEPVEELDRRAARQQSDLLARRPPVEFLDRFELQRRVPDIGVVLGFLHRWSLGAPR